MGRKLAFVVLCVLSLSCNALSRELEIGHLETADDPDGLNWLFFHCVEDRMSLDCDILQTLISHEVAATERDKHIDAQMKGISVEAQTKGIPVDDYIMKDFRKAFRCDNITEGRAAIVAMARTGKGPDGQPISADEVQDILKTFDAMANICLKPSLESVRHLIETKADDEARTCIISNEYSHEQFHFSDENGTPKKWVAQEGPTGPCGFMNIDTLERDQTYNTFWMFTERKIKTNPNGNFPSGELLVGHSCSEFPETTFHYTWKVQDKFMQCTHVKHR